MNITLKLSTNLKCWDFLSGVDISFKHFKAVKILLKQNHSGDISHQLHLKTPQNLLVRYLPPDQKCWQHSSREITTRKLPTLLVRLLQSFFVFQVTGSMNGIFNRLLIFLAISDNLYIVCSMFTGIKKFNQSQVCSHCMPCLCDNFISNRPQ